MIMASRSSSLDAYWATKRVARVALLVPMSLTSACRRAVPGFSAAVRVRVYSPVAEEVTELVSQVASAGMETVKSLEV